MAADHPACVLRRVNAPEPLAACAAQDRWESSPHGSRANRGAAESRLPASSAPLPGRQMAARWPPDGRQMPHRNLTGPRRKYCQHRSARASEKTVSTTCVAPPSTKCDAYVRYITAARVTCGLQSRLVGPIGPTVHLAILARTARAASTSAPPQAAKHSSNCPLL